MALTEQFANKEKMILFGGLFGVFASVSALCNRFLARLSLPLYDLLSPPAWPVTE